MKDLSTNLCTAYIPELCPYPSTSLGLGNPSFHQIRDFANPQHHLWFGETTMTDVRLDHALLARHACCWGTEISHKHKCIFERGLEAGHKLDHGKLS